MFHLIAIPSHVGVLVLVLDLSRHVAGLVVGRIVAVGLVVWIGRVVSLVVVVVVVRVVFGPIDGSLWFLDDVWLILLNNQVILPGLYFPEPPPYLLPPVTPQADRYTEQDDGNDNKNVSPGVILIS